MPPAGREAGGGGAPPIPIGGAAGMGGAEFRGPAFGGGNAKNAVALGSFATSSSPSWDNGTIESIPVSSGARSPIWRRFFRGGAAGGANGDARLAPPPTGGRLGLRPPPPPLGGLPAMDSPLELGGGGGGVCGNGGAVGAGTLRSERGGLGLPPAPAVRPRTLRGDLLRTPGGGTTPTS
jgi:hypothetical protein